MIRRRTAALWLLAACLASPALAQTSSTPSRGWVDVNFGAAWSTQGEQAYTRTTTMFLEQAVAATGYPEMPSTFSFSVEGGVNFGPSARGFGMGVRFEQLNFDYTVGLAVLVPHPLFFNLPGVDVAVTDSELNRRDRALDVMATYTFPMLSDTMRVRVFGGPTFFNVHQEMVGGISYSQAYNNQGLNAVDITSFVQQDTKGSGVGLNVGADVAYFLGRYVGVGGGLRFNSGTVNIVLEPLSGQEVELDTGALTVAGGIRFRF